MFDMFQRMFAPITGLLRTPMDMFQSFFGRLTGRTSQPQMEMGPGGVQIGVRSFNNDDWNFDLNDTLMFPLKSTTHKPREMPDEYVH